MLTIIFFGPDASGKSTQVKLVTSYLRSEGYRVQRVWIRAHHSFVFVILKFLFKADLDNDPFLKESKVGPALSKSRTWLYLEVISVFPWILFRFYLPRLLGYAVICDRYVLDTLVSLAYTCNDESIFSKFPSKVLFQFIPKDVFLVHLTGDALSLQRRSKEGNVVKNSIEFQTRHYKQLATSLNAKIIDTSILDVNETYAEIMAYLTTRALPTSPQLCL